MKVQMEEEWNGWNGGRWMNEIMIEKRVGVKRQGPFL